MNYHVAAHALVRPKLLDRRTWPHRFIHVPAELDGVETSTHLPVGYGTVTEFRGRHDKLARCETIRKLGSTAAQR
jgi:hypothetical protein